MFLFQTISQQIPQAAYGKEKAEVFLSQLSSAMKHILRSDLSDRLNDMQKRLETAFFGKPIAKFPKNEQEAKRAELALWLGSFTKKTDDPQLAKTAAFLLPGYLESDSLEQTASKINSDLRLDFVSSVSMRTNLDSSIKDNLRELVPTKVYGNSYVTQAVPSSIDTSIAQETFYQIQISIPNFLNISTNMPRYEVLYDGFDKIIREMGGTTNPSTNTFSISQQNLSQNAGIFGPMMATLVENWLSSSATHPDTGAQTTVGELVSADLKEGYTLQDFKNQWSMSGWKDAINMLRTDSDTYRAFGDSVKTAQNMQYAMSLREIQELAESAYSGSASVFFDLNPRGTAQLAIWVRYDGMFLVENKSRTDKSYIDQRSGGFAFIGTVNPYSIGSKKTEVKLNLGTGITTSEGSKPAWYLTAGVAHKIPLHRAVFGCLNANLAALNNQGDWLARSKVQTGIGFKAFQQRLEVSSLAEKDLSLGLSNIINNTDYKGKGPFIDRVEISSKYAISPWLEIGFKGGMYTNRNKEGDYPYDVGLNIGLVPGSLKKTK